MRTVEYACADGTPFPVAFATVEDEALEWRLEREHSSGPMTPLVAALGRLGRAGGERAYAEAGLPYPSIWRAGPEANGFPYFTAAPPTPEEMALLFETCGRLVQVHGSALGIWREHSLPRVRSACALLQSAPADAPLQMLAEQHDYAFHHTMVSAYVTGNDMRLLIEVLVDLYGDGAQLVALELSQGYDNATLGADQQLWALARTAAREPALAQALAVQEPRRAMAALRTAGSHAEFFDGLDAFLDEYGWRAEMWSIDNLTWREQGDGFWAQLRQLGRDDLPAPDEARRRAEERRRALAATIEERLASDPDQLGRFQRRIGRLATYVPVREERALWQLVAVGSVRHALLRRGEALATAGQVDRADDVFFLLPDEVEGDGELRPLVARRRTEHERWSATEPPAVIGTAAAAPQDAQAGDASVLRGTPAARGVATGRARIVLDLCDADRLEPGDVLVCTMTAPPWTPLFGIAGAVVTDTGDIGSHPSIAAREYGLPCVVGTQIGTKAIPDGARVVVDGGAGTVRIEAS